MIFLQNDTGCHKLICMANRQPDVDEKKKGLRKITKPRPGHADLWAQFHDLRNLIVSLNLDLGGDRVAAGASGPEGTRRLPGVVLHALPGDALNWAFL